MSFEATPSIFYSDAGRVNGCGLRIFGLEELVSPPRFRSVDISFLLANEAIERGAGMIKAASIEAAAADLRVGRPSRTFKVSDGWIRAPEAERTVPLQGKVLQSAESPNAAMYLASVTPILKVVDAVMEGKPLHVGIKRHGETINPVYYGVATIKEGDRAEFVRCLGDLVAGLKTGSE